MTCLTNAVFLLKLLSSTFARFAGIYFRRKFYLQILGVAMGSLVSVIIANLVMENVEEGAMSTFLNPPKFWRGYVDDTFVIIKKNRG